MVGMFYGNSKTPSFPYLAHRYLTSRMSAIGNRNDCFAEFHCATLSCLIEASYLQRQRGEKSKALLFHNKVFGLLRAALAENGPLHWLCGQRLVADLHHHQ